MSGGLFCPVYFCRSEDKRGLGVFTLYYKLNINLERLGTEVGSSYEHCTVGYMFVLLAQLLPAPIKSTAGVPCIRIL
jgi:hypothetical protein